jgi:opacity protein-like surface antigen
MFLIAALLLIGAASTASAQYLPYKGCSSLRERGYYGTPTGGGPQYDYGGGDQYGYGPGYSYARQAPPCNSRETSRVGAQRGLIAHEK